MGIPSHKPLKSKKVKVSRKPLFAKKNIKPRPMKRSAK